MLFSPGKTGALPELSGGRTWMGRKKKEGAFRLHKEFPARLFFKFRA